MGAATTLLWAVDLTMTMGMEENSIVQFFVTARHLPVNMVIVPASLLGK
jgi:hypothetical protein